MSELKSMIADLSVTFNDGYGIETAEPALFEIVDMLRGDAGLKAQFLEIVEQTFEKRWPYSVGKNGVPMELIELVTHELRWPEFAALADKRIQNIFGGDERLSIGDMSHGVKAAYADDWEDREFFKRYAVK